MEPSSIREYDLVHRVNESVKQFYTVLVIAVGLAFVLSFAGSLLVSSLSDTGWVQGWYIWTILVLLVALLLSLLWRFVAPLTSYHESITLKLVINNRRNEVLWSPSWTYMAGASAHQVCEVLQKRGLLSLSELEDQGDSWEKTWIQDLPGYLLLRWLSSFGLTARPAGTRLKPVALSDLPAWIGQNNRLVDLISKIETPSGFIEVSVSQLTIKLPEGFTILAPANKQETVGVLNLQGIALTNRYCRVEVLIGPMFPSIQPPVIRSAPTPSIDGMPINAAQPEYYLEQLQDIMVASWPMVLTVEHSAGMLLLRPLKAQRFIKYFSEMADAFVEFFNWDSALTRARVYEKEQIYDLLMEIQADIQSIRQKLDQEKYK